MNLPTSARSWCVSVFLLLLLLPESALGSPSTPAPAKAEPGGIASALTTFKEVQWETYANRGPDFTLQYPYEWEIGKAERPGEIFTAYVRFRAPGLSVSTFDQPPGLTLDASALAAARQLSPSFVVESQRSVDLGGTPARVAVGRWSLPLGSGVSLRTIVVSVFVAQRWVLVFGTDGLTAGGLLPELERAALSIRFTPTARAAQ